MVHLPLSVQYLTVAWLRNGNPQSTETCSPLFELIITGPVRKKMEPISGENEQNYPDKNDKCRDHTRSILMTGIGNYQTSPKVGLPS